MAFNGIRSLRSLNGILWHSMTVFFPFCHSLPFSNLWLRLPFRAKSPNVIHCHFCLRHSLLTTHSSLTKKTATHPCSGLFIRALPPLCTPILAEFLAGLCGDKCTFTQTFGKDRKNNSKCKMQSAKIKISFGIIYFRLAQPNRHSEWEKRAWESPTEQHARRLPQSLCSFAMTDKPKVYNPEKK